MDVAGSSRRLVFLGDRQWPPNQEAFEILLQWWPDIARGIDGAELCIVGSPDTSAKQRDLPDGVRDLGFVDDLDAFLDSCRALVAPIMTGGGVRVKILDAASRGLPVVGTPAAVGSLEAVLGVSGLPERAEIVSACRELLLDRDKATAIGDALFQTNSSRWFDRKPHTSVAEWLAAS